PAAGPAGRGGRFRRASLARRRGERGRSWRRSWHSQRERQPTFGSALHVPKYTLGRVVPGRADHRAGRVRAGAAGVKARERLRVGEAIGEAEAVVDVVDGAAGDAEVALDLLRVEHEGVDHQVRGPGREAIAQREQVPGVALLLDLPARLRELV